MTSLVVAPHSELAPYTLGNEAVPEHLLSKCKPHLDALENAVLAADSELELLQKRIQQLILAKDNIKRQQQAYTTLFSPFRITPNEIIACIIQSTLSDPYLLDRTDRIMLRKMMSVCRRWRDVASQSPQLWRGLDLTLPNDFHGKDDQVVTTLLSSWFARGGKGAPLRLRVRDTNRNLFAMLGRSFDISRSVVPFILSSPHWGELELLECNAPVILAIVANPSPIEVKCLSLSLTPNWNDSGDMGGIKFTEETLPRLESLSLGNIIPPTGGISLEHTVLVSLHIHKFEGQLQSLISTLSEERLPRLEELVLERLEEISDSDGCRSTLAHSAVKRLVVIGANTVALLNHCMFPNLELLRLCNIKYSKGSSRKTTVEAFVRRLPNSFHSLSLEDSKLDAPMLGPLVVLASAVRNVHVRSPAFLNHIGKASDNTLRNLEAVYCHESNYSSEGLFKHLSAWFSRRKSLRGPASKRITIYMHGFGGDFPVSRSGGHISTLREAGVDLQNCNTESVAEWKLAYKIRAHHHRLETDGGLETGLSHRWMDHVWSSDEDLNEDTDPYQSDDYHDRYRYGSPYGYSTSYSDMYYSD
ncbi:hypothetical protein FA15DRAFT_669122 [Coprinopsis marcescibilis]|uniref:F-box domain-containing protein n=1 Tax=Coprinopsis marcescibilis TaxID=230819 RepID=A0A5C3KWU3_COPMA|nr:hypothetical protein FA15DRAFT_669122 [Coprinopsis marcescibilis]